jgi:aromatic ring-cleaving dioxygenase
MNNYHAHVYYPLSECHLGQEIHARGRRHFGNGKLHIRPVGPHHLPMVEFHFNEEGKAAALAWLEVNRLGLSVLVHRDTGDDVHDHTHHVLWLGAELPIHFDFFRQVLADPSIAIHPLQQSATAP